MNTSSIKKNKKYYYSIALNIHHYTKRGSEKYIYYFFFQQMDPEENSEMFKVDFSEEHQRVSSNDAHFFNKETQIIQSKQKRKVVYGAMEEEQKSIYEIISPYLQTMAKSTGTIANQVGQGLYAALSTGVSWAYDKFVNTFIPYTKEQIPKLIFVVTKRINEQPLQSDAFQVIEVDDPAYEEIKKHQTKQKKTRIIVQLDKNDDKQLAKIIQKQKYVENHSFPIDIQSEQSESFLVPSASFVCLHNQIAKNYEKELEPIEQAHEEKEESRHQVDPDLEEKLSKVQHEYKRPQTNPQRNVYKLNDCYIFQLEGQNSIQYDLLDGIQKHEKTQTGYLINPQRVICSEISSDSDKPHSGETPLIIAEEKNIQKKIQEKPIRVQIPTNIQYESKQKKSEQKKELSYN